MDSGMEIKEVVLRDLEPLLRESIGEEVVVESFTTKSLLPPGENYGSTIMSVHAIIRKKKTAEEEDLHLVAKMSPPTEFQRRIFNCSFTLRKEVYMYEKLLPSYNRLEIEYGAKEDQVFDVIPRFYGSRTSLMPDVDYDDDAVILLENLKVRGYYTGNRCKGYDYEHSKLAVKALARFHALGIAMKLKKPEIFEEIKIRSKCFDIKLDDFKDMHLSLLKAIKDHPETSPYYERCLKAMTIVSPEKFWTEPPLEPWSTIIHTDFWVNNIMFHRGEDGRVDDIKFIDFQNYLFMSPLRELVFYLYSSVDEETQNTHVDDLMDLYFENFTSILSKMACDPLNVSETKDLFDREKFQVQVGLDAQYEFVHLAFMLKILTLDVKETNFNYDKMENLMLNYEGSRSFVDRLSKLVLCFVRRNWI